MLTTCVYYVQPARTVCLDRAVSSSVTAVKMARVTQRPGNVCAQWAGLVPLVITLATAEHSAPTVHICAAVEMEPRVIQSMDVASVQPAGTDISVN